MFQFFNDIFPVVYVPEQRWTVTPTTSVAATWKSLRRFCPWMPVMHFSGVRVAVKVPRGLRRLRVQFGRVAHAVPETHSSAT